MRRNREMERRGGGGDLRHDYEMRSPHHHLADVKSWSQRVKVQRSKGFVPRRARILGSYTSASLQSRSERQRSRNYHLAGGRGEDRERERERINTRERGRDKTRERSQCARAQERERKNRSPAQKEDP